jgi:hypothetical protein
MDVDSSDPDTGNPPAVGEDSQSVISGKTLGDLQGKSALDNPYYKVNQTFSKQLAGRKQSKFQADGTVSKTKYTTRFRVGLSVKIEAKDDDQRKLVLASASKFLQVVQQIDQTAQILPYEKGKLLLGPPCIKKPDDFLDLPDFAQLRKFLYDCFPYGKNKEMCQARILIGHDEDREELLEKLQKSVGRGTDVPNCYVSLNELQVEQIACAGLLWGAYKHHSEAALSETLSKIIKIEVSVADRIIFPGQGVQLTKDQKSFQRTFHVYCAKNKLFDVKKALRKIYDPKASKYPLNLKFQYGPVRKELALFKSLKVFDEMTYAQYK